MKADYKTFGLHNQLLSKLSGYNVLPLTRETQRGRSGE